VFITTSLILGLSSVYLSAVVIRDRRRGKRGFCRCLQWRDPAVVMNATLLSNLEPQIYVLTWYRVYLLSYAALCGLAGMLQSLRLLEVRHVPPWAERALEAAQLYTEHLPLEGLLFNLLFMGEGWRSWSCALFGGNLFAAVAAAVSLACESLERESLARLSITTAWRLVLCVVYVMTWKRPCCKTKYSYARPKRGSLGSIRCCWTCKGRTSLQYFAKSVALLWLCRAAASAVALILFVSTPDAWTGFEEQCVDDIVTGLVLIVSPVLVVSTLTKDASFWLGDNEPSHSRRQYLHGRRGDVTDDSDGGSFSDLPIDKAYDYGIGDRVSYSLGNGDCILAVAPASDAAPTRQLSYFQKKVRWLSLLRQGQRVSSCDQKVLKKHAQTTRAHINFGGHKFSQHLDVPFVDEMSDDSVDSTRPDKSSVVELYEQGIYAAHGDHLGSLDSPKPETNVLAHSSSWSRTGGHRQQKAPVVVVAVTSASVVASGSDDASADDSQPALFVLPPKPDGKPGKRSRKERRRFSELTSLRTPLSGIDLTPGATRATAKHLDRLKGRVAPLLRYDDLAIHRSKGRQITLGAGSTARVYHGLYKNTRDVAIKMVFTPEATEQEVENLLHEAGLLGHVRGANIVELIGVCIHPPVLCFVMEYCDGGSLFDQLHAADRLGAYTHKLNVVNNIDRCLEVAFQCARAVAWLHGKAPPVVHGDIKSGNFLLVRRESERETSQVDEAEFEVKLADLEWSRGMCGFTGSRTTGIPSPTTVAEEVNTRGRVSEEAKAMDLSAIVESEEHETKDSTVDKSPRPTGRTKRFRISLKKKKTQKKNTTTPIPEEDSDPYDTKNPQEEPADVGADVDADNQDDPSVSHHRSPSLVGLFTGTATGAPLTNPATIGHLTSTPEAYPWLAPERLAFRGNPSLATPAGDVYALAIVIWEIFHQAIPFALEQDVFQQAQQAALTLSDQPLDKVASLEEFITTIQTGQCQLSFRTHFPPELITFMERAFVAHPAIRPTAQAFVETLASIIASRVSNNNR
jgi:serine/threonine protein kinase